MFPPPHLFPVAYYHYVEILENQNPLEVLKRQEGEIAEIWEQLSENQALFRYAEGKWSLKEMLGHLNDTERIMSYRLMRIARGDAQALAGYDEDSYVENGRFDEVLLANLLVEWKGLRSATIALIHSLSQEALLREGIANNSPITAAALTYLIAGHAEHHLKIVKERYLPLLK